MITMEDLRIKIAKRMYDMGVKPSVSSGICGGITYGYGELDCNGYWDYMVKIEYDKPWEKDK